MFHLLKITVLDFLRNHKLLLCIFAAIQIISILASLLIYSIPVGKAKLENDIDENKQFIVDVSTMETSSMEEQTDKILKERSAVIASVRFFRLYKQIRL